MMRSVSSLTHVVNRKSLAISLLAVFATWLCLKLDIKADFPLTLIATAIVFPIVFSISTAYNRRQKALEEYGAMKACGRSLYIASSDWVSQTDERRDAELKSALFELLAACGDLFMSPLGKGAQHESGSINRSNGCPASSPRCARPTSLRPNAPGSTNILGG